MKRGEIKTSVSLAADDLTGPAEDPAPVTVMTFNVELANGDLDVAVDKLGEVQKNVRDVVVVIVVVDPPAGAAGRSAFEDAGSGRAEDARQQVARVAVRGESRLRACSTAARALGGAAGALGGASDRIGARIGSSPVGPHFS